MLKIAAKLIFLVGLLALAFGLNLGDFPRAKAAGESKGRIIVRSNAMTSWVVSGPENFAGTGNFGSYYANPSPGDYFISAPALPGLVGPQYLPGMNQTVKAGETVYFDIIYKNPAEPELGVGPEDCSATYRFLEGHFINDGKYSGIATGTMKNKSSTCTYQVGIASYKMYYEEMSGGNDQWLDTQTLFQTKNFTLAPGQILGPDVVNITLPPCRTQLDMFEGPALTPPVYNTPGHFLMDYRFVDKEICDLYEYGVLTVNSNIPTAWIINGPENFAGSGTYASYSAIVGGYTLNNVPTQLVYNNKNYELVSAIPQTQTVSASTLTQFTIQYAEKWTLSKPTISGASNAQCSKINVTWNDASTNETGFKLYRATQDFGSNLASYQLVATLPANTTSYVDSPSLNNSYYYVVAAYSTSPSAVTASNPFYSSFNQPCTAQIDGTLKIVAINGNPDTANNAISNGDTLTMELMIDNFGPAAGYITKITETLSPNLTNPHNLQGNGPNMVLGTPKIIGSAPEFTVNVSGKKDVGGLKWMIRYDVIASTSAGNMAAYSNCATIHYYDQTGNKTEKVCINQLMNSVEQKEGLRFREVAPR